MEVAQFLAHGTNQTLAAWGTSVQRAGNDWQRFPDKKVLPFEKFILRKEGHRFEGVLNWDPVNLSYFN